MTMFQGVRIQSLPIYGNQPIARPAPRGYRPPAPLPRVMGQLVTVNPNIKVDVNTGIEQYLFPIGLMAGGGAVFVLGTAIPESVRSVTTVAGLALLAAGVGVLIYRGVNKPAPAGAPAPAAPASGGISVDNAPAFQPPTREAFSALQLAIASPQSGQSVSASGGFLGLGAKTIPVQLQMYNPSPVEVTFNLDFVWDEMPSLAGYDRGQYHGATSYQVTLGAGEAKNQTFNLPVQTDVSWSQIQADLQMYTKRTPVDSQQLLANLTFTVV